MVTTPCQNSTAEASFSAILERSAMQCNPARKQFKPKPDRDRDDEADPENDILLGRESWVGY
jgi:hypothetical protein